MSKTLIAFFSASGTTAKTAGQIAKAAENADIFEIKPVTPYTDADLKWTNPFARCNKEKISKKDVPISGKIENISEYDLILIGFPIWYYGAPNIIQTFLKQYDFSGKKLALFATSGGSDISKTADKLKPYLSDTAGIAGAKLFKQDETDKDIADWLKSL